MRWALALGLSTMLTGCANYMPGGFGKESDNEDCGKTQDFLAPGTWDMLTTSEFREGMRTYYFSFAPDPAACIDQHAPYTAKIRVEKATEDSCVDTAQVFVSLQQSAGFFGATHELTGTPAENGALVFEKKGEIGTGQFDEPTYLSLLAKVALPGTPSESFDLPCAKQRISSISMTMHFQPSIAGVGGASEG